VAGALKTNKLLMSEYGQNSQDNNILVRGFMPFDLNSLVDTEQL